MMGRQRQQRQWAAEELLERAEFVERTVKEVWTLLRSGAPYPEVSVRVQRAKGALQSIGVTLWQQELVRATGSRRRDAA